MMESDKVHKCLGTDEKFLDWKVLYQNMERLLKKEMSHYDGAVVVDHPAFRKALQLHQQDDGLAVFETGVRHV